MYVSGTTVLTGGGLEARPVPYSHTVTYRPVVRRNTSPFLNAPPQPASIVEVKEPEPKPKKAKVKRRKRESSGPSRTHVPYYEQERIVQARVFMETPKICLHCNEKFEARPGERIDGYRRRETCNRVCAARRARLRREGKLDD